MFFSRFYRAASNVAQSVLAKFCTYAQQTGHNLSNTLFTARYRQPGQRRKISATQHINYALSYDMFSKKWGYVIFHGTSY